MFLRLWWPRGAADSAKPQQPSSSRGSDRFSIIEDMGDMDGQKKCRGCKQLWNLLEFRKRKSALPPLPKMFHTSYASLDKCAQQCVTCRVFRQALLLETVTADDAAALATSAGAVFAQLVPAPKGFAIRIQVKDGQDTVVAEALVRSSSEKLNATAPINLSLNPADEAIYSQVKAWLRVCEHHHIDCGNLAFSDRKPTRLLRILSDSQAQLIDPHQARHEKLRYAALSYCWGHMPEVATGVAGELTKKENEIVRQGKTTRDNLESRYEPFPIASLPGTVRDAIKITLRLNNPQEGLELRHIWVDTLCIIQDDADDKKLEIQRMQEVYGNAMLTICATATSKATQALLQPRLAWSKPVRPCRIGDVWLAVEPTPPADLRRRAALAKRAWTLQEQQLSPRLLFWSGQQLSWACGYGECAERVSSPSSQGSLPGLADISHGHMAVRNFLTACRAPEASQLCLIWHDMVESYTARKLTSAADRFPALAGLATRYLAAMSGDMYMAGLWRETFAQDVLWRVSQPAMSASLVQSNAAHAPSWSWASLPIGLAVHMSRIFHMRAEIELLGDPDDMRYARLEPSDAVAEGAKVCRIRVRAPMRKLWRTGSQPRAWDQICVRADGVEKFRLATPNQDVHAVDRHTARVMVYEARKQEVVVQLDYAEHAVQIDEGRLDVYCLAVSEQGMLLVEYHEPTYAYRRVGAALEYRSDFFKGIDREEIILE